MGILCLKYFVALFLLSGLVGLVSCQGIPNCPAPPCRGMPCGPGMNCGSLSCQCTLFSGKGICTSCAGELCACSNASGSARQTCCGSFKCVLPNRMPAVGDGQCRNLAKGI